MQNALLYVLDMLIRWHVLTIFLNVRFEVSTAVTMMIIISQKMIIIIFLKFEIVVLNFQICLSF
jgi:hypothetical protein